MSGPDLAPGAEGEDALGTGGKLTALLDAGATDTGATFLFSSHSQRVCHAIDVIEPRRNERDLQDSSIVKSRGPQSLDIVFPNFRCILGQLDHVIEHHAILGRNRRRGVVLLQRRY